MPRLVALERFLERLFERPGARLFRPSIQPIQIQRRVERAMEHARRPEAGRVAVPDHYTVRLNPADLVPDEEAAQRLAGDLADAVLRFARAHRYALTDRPSVELVADPGMRRGDIEVVPTASKGRDRAREVPPPGSEAPRSAPSVGVVEDGRLDGTARFAIPPVRIPATVLRLVGPNGRERRFKIATPTVTIGRDPTNQLVVDDRRVSRQHARLTARSGGLVFTDLDSTNGSIVNGKRVRELALGPGDRIELGRTVLIVESMDAPSDAG